MKKIMIGVCIVSCTKCVGPCICGTAKGPHFKSMEHKQAHQRFVRNIFALVG